MISFFQYGEFSSFDANMAGRSLAAFASGLFAFVSVKVLAPAFFARQDIKTPVKAGAIAVVVNILFSLLLIRPLAHVGLAVATSIAGFVNAGLLYWWLRVDRIYKPANGWLSYFLRVTFAAALMGLVIALFANDPRSWLEASATSRVTLLVKEVLVGSSVYFLTLYAMGIRLGAVLRNKKND
jgi:putative peptidoglycan lipid II flippase